MPQTSLPTDFPDKGDMGYEIFDEKRDHCIKVVLKP